MMREAPPVLCVIFLDPSQLYKVTSRMMSEAPPVLFVIILDPVTVI